MIDVSTICRALKDLNNRLASVEHTVNDVLVKSILEANSDYEFDEFKDRYHDQLDGICGKLKALYGDDYDGYKDLYEVMKTHVNDDGFDEAKYIASQIEQVNAKLNALVETAGNTVAPMAKETVVTVEPDVDELIDKALK